MRVEVEVTLFISIYLGLVYGQPRYIYFNEDNFALNGAYACTCIGAPAIVDTEEKQNHLLQNIDIPPGECAWIGAGRLQGDNAELQWIQLLSNRTASQEFTPDGPLLRDTYNNFAGSIPEPDGQNTAVCIESDGTWRATDKNDRNPTVCERLECGPGTYKQLGQPGGLNDIELLCRLSYGLDLCVDCPDGTVKNVVGDSMSLCKVPCASGMSDSPSDPSVCACDAGFFKNGDSCSLCTGNTIKIEISNITNCDADPPCDGTTTVPNDEHTRCVCNAGYFKHGDSCILCPGNTIKMTTGDATNCDTDPPCDGTKIVPNAGHTACVCIAGYFQNGDSCSQCTGNRIKPEVGNATHCDSCKNSMVTNNLKTECVCAPGYYGPGSWCALCPPIRIKPQAGNADACPIECNFPYAYHNPQHTACLCNCGYFKNGESCTLCTGNKIKTAVSNATHCDADPPCDGTSKVPNEDHTACVNKPPPPCFPSTAKVFIENGKLVRMSELKNGDKVRTGGVMAYSEVRTFLKKQPSVITMYKSISTSFNTTVSLSRNHLIYARRSCTDRFNPIYADEVSVGDEVLVNENDEFVPAKVTNVSSAMMQGAYAPLTMAENIVVDGVLTSCYANTDHDLAHFMMIPMQWFSVKMDWVFGDDIELPAYFSIGRDLGILILPDVHHFK